MRRSMVQCGIGGGFCGSSGSGGESVAAKELFGEKALVNGKLDVSRLTQEDKEKLSVVGALVGAASGYAVGGDTADAQVGGAVAQNAVENNNFSFQDVKDNWNRLTGGLLGVAASFGSAGEPFLHPIDTWNGLKEFANSDDKLAVLQMGLILTVEERNQDYETFVRLNDEFGKSMVIGRSVTDITSAVTMISKTPALFKTALAQLRKTGHATINGVKVVYVSGKIARALDNYVAPVQIYKPVPAITQTAKKLPQGKGGQNTLATRERVNSNIQETRRGNQSSEFKTHAQRERENKTQIIEKSTGRTIPKDLREKLAMEQVKANPQGITPPRMPPMSDAKNGWLAQDGWVKRTQNVNGIEIHYIENTKTGQKTDFKFKD